MKYKKYPLVMVEWEDSIQANPNWQGISELRKIKSGLCITVGYLLKETKDCVEIAQAIGKPTSKIEEMLFSANATIVKSAIKRVTELEKGKKWKLKKRYKPMA